MEFDAEKFIDRLVRRLHIGDQADGTYTDAKKAVRGAWGFAVPDSGMVVTSAKSARSEVIGVCQAWPDRASTVALSYALEGGTASGLIVGATISGTRFSAKAPNVTVIVPPWGICLPVNASQLDIAMAIVNNAADVKVRPIGGVSYGSPVRSWQPDISGPFVFGGSHTLIPPTWARRVRITVLSGGLTAPSVIAAGSFLVLNAAAWVMTDSGGGSTVDVSWETVAA